MPHMRSAAVGYAASGQVFVVHILIANKIEMPQKAWEQLSLRHNCMKWANQS